MMLKVVLLPAPLGPITPRISPSRTSKSSPLTAVRPPKRLLRFLTSRTTDGIVKADQAFRLQENRRDDEHAEHQDVVMAHQRRKEERQQEKQRRADDRAGMAPRASHDHHEEQEERVLQAEDRR